MKAPLEAAGLLEYAVKSLGSKMKSERDLRQKLRERAEPGDAGKTAIDGVILKLKELGYLSDERFAADFARLRQENEKFGRRRVGQGLAQKGIAQDLANEALTRQYDEVDEVALARQYIERKRMKEPTGDLVQKRKQTARAMRRLVAAGFTTKTVWVVLRSWGAGVEEIEMHGDEGDAEDDAGLG